MLDAHTQQSIQWWWNEADANRCGTASETQRIRIRKNGEYGIFEVGIAGHKFKFKNKLTSGEQIDHLPCGTVFVYLQGHLFLSWPYFRSLSGKYRRL